MERAIRAVTPAETSGLLRRWVDRDATERIERLLETALGFPFTDGNRIEVLRNGDEIFPPMLRAIEEAREYVDFLTYVYWKGEIAVRFAHTLADAARRGVDVRVLLDGIGSRPMDPGLLDVMENAGVKVRRFREPSWRVWRTTHRTHRKVLICDGQVGFTGGVGIADEWGGDARSPDEWRDTHLAIRGPAVAGLQSAFTGNWLEEHRDVSELQRYVDRRPRGGSRIQVVRSNASVGWSDVATLMWALIESAETSLRIATGYFVPDEDTRDRLCDAAQRGVDVEILIPGPYTDFRITQLAHAPDVAPLLEAGVRIQRYQPTMMHAKIVIVDSTVALVGSPNLNHRSMQQDDECCVVISDPEVVETLERHWAEDMDRSEPADLERWDDRSWWRRVVERLSRLFLPQL